MKKTKLITANVVNSIMNTAIYLNVLVLLIASIPLATIETRAEAGEDKVQWIQSLTNGIPDMLEISGGISPDSSPIMAVWKAKSKAGGDAKPAWLGRLNAGGDSFAKYHLESSLLAVRIAEPLTSVRRMDVMPDGGVTVLVGSGNAPRAFVRLKNDRTPLFATTIGPDQQVVSVSIHKVLQTSRGSYILVGKTAGNGTLIGISAKGDKEWEISHATSGVSMFTTGDIFPGGQFVVAGEVVPVGANKYGVGPGRSVWIMTCNERGEKTREVVFGGRFARVCRTETNTITILYDNSTQDITSSEWRVKRLSKDLVELWDRDIGKQAHNVHFARVVSVPSGILVSGVKGLLQSRPRPYFVELSNRGDVLWERECTNTEPTINNLDLVSNGNKTVSFMAGRITERIGNEVKVAPSVLAICLEMKGK